MSKNNKLKIVNSIKKETIIEKEISDKMVYSYLSYSLSVIINRALPDVRDGLKPVQRSILYAMYRLHNFPDKPTKKSARIVGDVIGKYSPHSDTASYGSMVNLVNDFHIRYPLIHKQGNFGSLDGDSAAAMRYTEAKLNDLSMDMLKDIDNHTVEMIPNYSEEELMPTVLPSLIPNLLVNGSSGIAVGYKTDIPSHNMKEVCNAIIHQIKNPNITIKQLMKFLPAPDLPSFGEILDNEGLYKLYSTGESTLTFKGKLTLEINEETNNNQIIITELPPDVMKPKFVEKLYNLLIEKNKQVNEIRDESSENNIRIVIELKKNTIPEVIINSIYNNTQFVRTKKYSMRAIVDNVPLLLNLKQINSYYIEHRKNVVKNRSKFRINKIDKQLNILNGFVIIKNKIKDVVDIIINSNNTDDIIKTFNKKYKLNEEQSNAIIDKKLRSLSKTETNKLLTQITDLQNEKNKLQDILNLDDSLNETIINELKEIIKKYGDKRKTQIIKTIEFNKNIDNVCLCVTNKNTIISSTNDIKNLKINNNVIVNIKEYNQEDEIIVLLKNGKYYIEHINNIINHNYKDVINIFVKNDTDKIIVVTKNGFIKKINLSSFNKKSSTYIKLQNDEIVNIDKFNNDEDIINIITKNGIIHRFKSSSFSDMSTMSKPIGCIKLSENDFIIKGLINYNDIITLLIDFEDKSSGIISFDLNEFNIKNRLSKGVKLFNKLNGVISNVLIYDKFINNNGKILELSKKDINVTTKGKKPIQCKYNIIDNIKFINIKSI